MSIDMSPAAVTARLKLLDQLWQLSVRLMRAKCRDSETVLFSEKSSAAGWSTPKEDGSWQHLTTLPKN
jgi:hypothetical protein